MVAQESRVLSVDPSVDPSKAHRRVGGAEPTYRRERVEDDDDEND